MQRRPIFFCQEAAALRTEAQKKVGGSLPPSLLFYSHFFFVAKGEKSSVFNGAARGEERGVGKEEKGPAKRVEKRGGGGKRMKIAQKASLRWKGRRRKEGGFFRLLRSILSRRLLLPSSGRLTLSNHPGARWKKRRGEGRRRMVG